MHALKMTRAVLLANPMLKLATESWTRFNALLDEREAGRPIQYITGVQEFYGLEFAVTTDVLIPRPETEHLVEAVLARISRDKPVQIADVGTGSGAIAVALAHTLPLAQVTALDISVAAIKVAARNAKTHGVDARVKFVESDLLAACTSESFNVIVSNPPYIAESERYDLEVQVREFEPPLALFAGSTGYEIYERLIPQAWNALRVDGLLAMEIGFGQSARIAELMQGWEGVEFVNDLQGIPRVVLARRG